MILSDLSVRRPVLATVLSLLLLAFGIVSFFNLPVREYPDTNPPVVSIETIYTGANAALIESQVTRVLEDQIGGIEGVKSIESVSRDGRSEITIEFELGRNVDAAANDVRDRVARVADELPEQAEVPEISKVDSSDDVIVWLSLSSPVLNMMELTDFADRFLVDRLAAVDGVARVRIGGERRFAMRIWLDPLALAARGLTVADVEAVLRLENVELPAGRLESTETDFAVRVKRAYSRAEDFRRMVLRRGADGHLVRLGEVAQVEVGPAEIRTELRGNGANMVGLGIIPQSTASTLAVATAVQAEVDRIQLTLPASITLENAFDTSVFIEESIAEVYKTLGIAAALVIAVIFLFLGNGRATLIPAVTVPISLVATFIVLDLFGFSINLLTLLALVLAIGLVVDDAIVVLENIHRRIELGEPPLLAAYRGAREVGFAVIATTLVLISVFVPIALIGGTVGRVFTELAVAIAAAVGFSSLVALTLAPMLCSKLLAPANQESWLQRGITALFDRLGRGYGGLLRLCIANPLAIGALVVGLGWLSVILVQHIPSEFAPKEDRGAFFIIVNGPEGAGFDYTQRYMHRIEDMLMPMVETGEATRVLVRVPLSFGRIDTANSGIGIVVMAPWQERDRSTFAVMGETFGMLSGLPGVRAFPVMRQGLSRGAPKQPVQFVIGGGSYAELAAWRDVIVEKAEAWPGLISVESDYKETKPQLIVSIDRNRAADLGVPLVQIGSALATLLGSRSVTTYEDRGEEYDVILQMARENRMQVSDMETIFVRSRSSGALIPLSNLVKVEERAESGQLNRYNRLRAITISASPAPGYSLGEGIAFLNETARKELPGAARIDYKGESKELSDSGTALYFTFGFALLMVFLVLAAQFESFIHPLTIMLTVPLAIAGALGGLILSGGTLNIYSQIGIVILVGLATKNGILIVEFANQLRDQGLAVTDALIQAAKARLRPIIMTGVSTALGAVPLVLAQGAGSASRATIGMVIMSGICAATFLTLFVVPTFYVLLGRFTRSPDAVTNDLRKLAKPGEI